MKSLFVPLLQGLLLFTSARLDADTLASTNVQSGNAGPSFSAASAGGYHWSSADDFSWSNNPNGVWQYGYKTSLADALTLYTIAAHLGTELDYWTSSLGVDPNVSHNPGSGPIGAFDFVLPPNRTAFHPGPHGEFSIFRWTAPRAGVFRIHADFIGLGSIATTDPHVLVNGVSIFDGTINGRGTTAVFDTTTYLSDGSVVDFAVGSGNDNYSADTTGINATIDSLGPAEVLANGGFESPALTANTYSSVAPAGWSWMGLGWIINGNGGGGLFGWQWPLAQEGQQYVDIGNDRSRSLSQSFTITVPGEYDLSWYDNTAFPQGPNSSPYSVSILDGANQPVASATFDAGHEGLWRNLTLRLDLLAGPYLLQFVSDGPGGGWDTVLDNVSLKRACVPTPSGLVAWWPGDGDGRDLIGAHSGSAGDGLAFTNAFAGDGFLPAGGFLRVPDAFQLRPDQITVMAWAKATNAGSTRYILSKSYSRSGSSYGMFSGPDGGLAFYLSQIGSSPSVGADIWDGRFHHLAGSYDGAFVRLYVDGVEAGSGSPASGSIAYGTAYENGDLIIGGCCPGESDGDWPGIIDEVAIFNRALSAGEIATIYAAGSGGMCRPGRPLVYNGDFEIADPLGWQSEHIDGSGGYRSAGGHPGAFFILNDAGQSASDPTLSQTITGLVAGATYLLSGEYASIYPGYGNPTAPSFGVSLDGNLVLELPRPALDGWMPFTVHFVASNTTVLLSLTGERNGDDSSYAVDNIALRPVIVDAQPPAISGLTVTPGINSVEISWRTDEPASAAVEYGPDFSYGLTNVLVTLEANHLITLTGLIPDTLYHFRARSVDLAGNEALPAESTFATLPAPDLQVRSLTASNPAVSGGRLTLSWSETNSGAGGAQGFWYDRVTVVNTNRNLTIADLTLPFDANASPLPPGATVLRSHTLTLPLGTSGAGGLLITVRADVFDALFEYAPGRDAETNNIATLSIASTLAPLPDLAIDSIIAPPAAVPGQSLFIVHVVTNRGIATAQAPWNDYLHVNPESGTAAFLGAVTVSNDLPAGASMTITQAVVLPLDGDAGSLRFTATADGGRVVVELDEDNNLAVSPAGTEVPLVLALSLSAPEVPESGSPLNVTVQRNGSRAGALMVRLASSDPAELVVPAGVTIAAGQAAAVFTATPQLDGLFDGPQSVVITAEATGFRTASTNLTVLDSDLPALAFIPAAPVLTEGTGASMIITRQLVTPTELIVSLQPDTISLATPATVTIPAGTNSASFPLNALNNTSFDPTTVHSIRASAPGYRAATLPVTVVDDDTPNLQLRLSASSVSENAGPNAVSATVVRDRPSTRPLVVALFSSNTNVARVPAYVTIPGGATNASFNVAAVDNADVDGTRVVTFQAWVVQSGGTQLLREGTPALLEVTDDDGPTLFVILARDAAGEGTTLAGTIRRNTGTNGALNVTLASDNPGEATVPAAVVIPPGSDSATFLVATVTDGRTDGNQRVTITASSPGYTSGSRTLTVSDADLPDLVVAGLTGPTNALTGQAILATYRIENQGVAATTNAFVQRLFLSDDAALGGDALVAQVEFPGPISPGLFFEQAFQVRMPGRPGNYWLIASADVNDAVTELLENNNTRVSSLPIVVSKAYSAAVAADIHQAAAGTAIPLRGRATRVDNGAAAAFELVNIHIVHGNTRRVFSALTDSAGMFSTVFTPLPGEAGNYSVAADHPGVSEPPSQDEFVLFGLRVDAPSPLALTEGDSAAGTVTVENLSDAPLSGLSAAVIAGPASPALSLSLATTALPSNGRLTLAFTVSAPPGLSGQGSYRVRVTAAEGVSAEFSLTVTVERLRPRLVVSPSSLTAGMKRGAQVSVTFGVTNLGGATTGPLNVLLPNFSWLTLASPSVVPSLAPGEGVEGVLLLTPPADLPLGPYSGSLALNATNTGVAVAFNFRCLSDAVGSLHILSVDEYTYYAEGAPKVTNASVRLTDAFSGATVLETNTAPTGDLVLNGIAEGYYELRVEAEQHSNFRQVVLVEASRTNEVTALMGRQSVRYVWAVTPVEIEDRYTITVETVFETVVPKPVIVVEPSVIDLTGMVENERQVNVSISNYGLIAAQAAKFTPPTHPDFTFAPLITNIGLLPAQSTLTIPVIVTRTQHALAARAAAESPPAESCAEAGKIEWDTPCGNHVFHDEVDLWFIGLAACIAESLGGDGTSPPPPPPVWDFFRGRDDAYVTIGPNGFSGGGIDLSAGTTNFGCNPCDLAKLRALYKCYWSFLPLPGGDEDCDPGECFDEGIVSYPCLKTGLVCAEVPERYIKVLDCYKDYVTACDDLPQNTPAARAIHAASVPGFVPDAEDVVLSNRVARLQRDIDWRMYYFGDAVWMGADEAALKDWLAAFGERIATNGISPAGALVTAEERAELLGLSLPAPVTMADAGAMIDRWNRSVADWNAGIFITANLPPGADTNFIDLVHLNALQAAALEARHANEAEGFSDPIQAIQAAQADIIERLSGGSGGGICARVRLRLDQTAVISRDAFNATLEVDNDTDGPLEQVFFDVRLARRDLGDTTSLFELRPPELTGISAVDGTGIIPAGGTARASVILVPTSLAAPTNATEHLVSGTLRYRQAGVEITIPLSAMPITVLPNPSLTVRYFHERDVFSDDPFTPEIEPAVPYSLAVMVENHGYGAARNLRINSAQPRIIENERGLLIDFQIIATEVAGRPLQPSLTVNLGDIGPGQTALGRWLFKSSLQGLFTDYQATFEHTDGKGDRRLSLIDRLEIHEMNHLVRADQPSDDGRFDFLVNDVPDLDDLPDTLWFSSGGSAPVSVLTNAMPDSFAGPGHLQVALSAVLPAGWTYLRLPDPGQGQFRLAAVLRADGSTLPSDNFWLTDRTFTGYSQRPRRENNLHLLEHAAEAGSARYTLIYEETRITPDLSAPVSAVAALPPVSAPEFAVTWDGQDESGGSGLAFFDVFVSADGGPFTNWLAHTALRGAVFTGAPGVTYRFFTRATDQAGNTEPAPAVPDGTTTVNLINNPPALALTGEVAVDEGEMVQFTALAQDNDLPAQSLRFELLPGAPPGATLDPLSGDFLWPTGEGNGPSTNLVRLRVTDNGLPPQSATGTVSIIVREVNSPPVIAALTNRIINEGFRLVVTNRGTDFDLPRQTLLWSLAAGAPEAAVIDPATGVLQWRPGSLAGPSTNVIRVVLTDDGVPPLSATQSVTVSVRDVLPDFTVRAGTTNLLAGESGQIPIAVESDLELRTVRLSLDLPVSGLEDIRVVPVADEIQSAILQPISSHQLLVTLETRAGESVLGRTTAAWLQFATSSNANSMIVPLHFIGVEGTTVSSGRLTAGKGLSGRVFVIGEQAILDASLSSNGTRSLVLYGQPGRHYSIQSRTNLLIPSSWSPWGETDLFTRWQTFTNVEPIQPTVFYRALSSGRPLPRLEVRQEEGQLIMEWVVGSGDCVLEESASLNPSRPWAPTAAAPQLVSGRYRLTVPVINGAKFYRLNCAQ